MPDRSRPKTTRRSLALGLGAGAVAGLLPAPARYGRALAEEPRRLRLYQPHTGESFDDAFHDGTAILEDQREALDWFLRDHHEDAATEMDAGVLDLLWRLGERYRIATGRRVTINIHSAFRTEATNTRLRSEGAALDSYHLRGQAVDVSVQGYGIHFLANHAQAIRTGGIGIYWRSRFCHLDTGPPRLWYRRV